MSQFAKTVAEAELPVERIKNAARDEGRVEGYAEGLSDGRVQGALGAAAAIGVGCAAVFGGIRLVEVITDKIMEKGWFDADDFDDFEMEELSRDDDWNDDDDIDISFGESAD